MPGSASKDALVARLTATCYNSTQDYISAEEWSSLTVRQLRTIVGILEDGGIQVIARSASPGAPSGKAHCFLLQHLVEWIQRNPTHPITRQPLTENQIRLIHEAHRRVARPVPEALSPWPPARSYKAMLKTMMGFLEGRFLDSPIHAVSFDEVNPSPSLRRNLMLLNQHGFFTISYVESFPRREGLIRKPALYGFLPKTWARDFIDYMQQRPTVQQQLAYASVIDCSNVNVLFNNFPTDPYPVECRGRSVVSRIWPTEIWPLSDGTDRFLNEANVVERHCVYVQVASRISDRGGFIGTISAIWVMLDFLKSYPRSMSLKASIAS